MKTLHQSSEFIDLVVQEQQNILCDKLNVSSEKFVFDAVNKWTKANLQAREQCLRTLIPCVRYGLMNFIVLNDNVINNELAVASPVCFHWMSLKL